MKKTPSQNQNQRKNAETETQNNQSQVQSENVFPVTTTITIFPVYCVYSVNILGLFTVTTKIAIFLVYCIYSVDILRVCLQWQQKSLFFMFIEFTAWMSDHKLQPTTREWEGVSEVSVRGLINRPSIAMWSEWAERTNVASNDVACLKRDCPCVPWAVVDI